MKGYPRPSALIRGCLAVLLAGAAAAADDLRGPVAPKPLFRDPVHDGAADPVVVWNRAEKKWFMLYTNRRANVPGLKGVEWVHGTRLGIAESADGAAWTYRGVAELALGGSEDAHWAPEVVDDGATYHMFVSLVPGMHADWGGQRFIHHLVSSNLLQWADAGRLPLASDRVIDACVLRLPDGTWRMWYNNEKDHKAIYRADSPDLATWTDRGKVIGDEAGEGPKVVQWRGWYWMVVDQWKGMGVYRSKDAQIWERQPERVLAQPGTGPDDQVMGGHADFVVSGDRAWFYYFTHPGRRGPDKNKDTTEQRRSSIQVVEMMERDGWLTCDRDQPTHIRLQPPAAAGGSYLFSYFIGNGEDGLHLAASRNGLTWEALNGGKSFLRPEVGGKLMRDPCICQGPDGTFHLVWTSSWGEQGIGLAHSKDLITWSPQQFLPVMAHEPGAMNAWAPEILYDAAAGQFLIYWSSTIRDRFPETIAAGGDRIGKTGVICNHRIYFTTTRDFTNFAPTALLYDPGFNCIDATIAPADGRWVMFIKDETKAPVAKKHIRMAWADRPTGPWGPAGAPISSDWVEGPTALQVAGEWLLYYDAYTRGRYEGVRSRDLATWQPLSGDLSFPKGLRHGTAFAVWPDVMENLRRR